MIRHLFVPGLLGPMPGLEREGRPALPHLETLLARADRLTEPAGYAGALFALFGSGFFPARLVQLLLSALLPLAAHYLGRQAVGRRTALAAALSGSLRMTWRIGPADALTAAAGGLLLGYGGIVGLGQMLAQHAAAKGRLVPGNLLTLSPRGRSGCACNNID